MMSVTKVVQEMVMNCSLPLKAVAAKIQKPYPTLLRELNPYDKGAKLGVETLLELMRVTNDASPLHHMAEELGYTLVPQHRNKPVNEKTAQKAAHAPLRDEPGKEPIYLQPFF